MARKARTIQDASSDDDAPEVVSYSTSKADAKRNQKALQEFEAEEKARKKARNRERDRKLKERAHATKGGKTDEKLKGVRFVDRALEGGDDSADDVEARMLRAMREAGDEMESEEEDEFKGFGQGSDESAEMSLGEDESIDPEAPTDDEEMDEEEETTLLQANIVSRPSRKANYLADELFAAAFASQDSKPVPKKSSETTQQQTVKKRRRKFSARPKDLVIGLSGRTIRTLPQLSDLHSQATARTVPSARARRFVDQSLAMKGKRSLAKARKKGWERRPANVGVMKYQGAPHGFARSTR